MIRLQSLVMALACVCLAYFCLPFAPALAGTMGYDALTLYRYAASASILFAILCISVILWAYARDRVPMPEARIWLLPVAFFVIMLAGPAFAAEATTSATIPWGEWLVATLQPVSAVLVPVAAAAVSAGVYKVAPWATLLLSRQRIEMMVQGGAAYGMNAVANAVQDKKVVVPLGSAVIAEGVQHIIDTSPQRAIKKAGGAAGIAGMVFRALPLEEGSSAETVLKPALKDLRARGLLT